MDKETQQPLPLGMASVVAVDLLGLEVDFSNEDTLGMDVDSSDVESSNMDDDFNSFTLDLAWA